MAKPKHHLADLETHYLYSLERIDLLIESAKQCKRALAGDLNTVGGGRRWSSPHFIFINWWSNYVIGLHLSANVCYKNGKVFAYMQEDIPALYRLGDKLDLVGRPSFSEFVKWYTTIFCGIDTGGEFAKEREAELLSQNYRPVMSIDESSLPQVILDGIANAKKMRGIAA